MAHTQKNSGFFYGNFSECECGKAHSFNSQVYESGEAEEALTALSPQGTHILYIGDSGTVKARLDKLYRVTHIVPSRFGIRNQAEGQGGCTEDIRLIASSGGGIPYGKYIASCLDLPHAVIGGGNLSEYAFVSPGGYASVKHCRAPVIICDESEVDVAAGFAGVVLTALSLFDWDVSALLFGGTVCPHIYREARRTINSLLKAAANCAKNSAALKKALLDAQVRLAVLSGYAGSAALNMSGAAQAAAALSMLFTHEKREQRSFEENAFLLSPVTAAAYRSFLSAPITFSPPPDNNLRVARISEYLGLSEAAAQSMMPPYPSRESCELNDYRLRLYGAELSERIEWVCAALDRCLPVYYKLCGDDGFSLVGYTDCLDVSLCLGLGSDVLPYPTLLSYMRQKGVLDRYIL